MPALLCFVEDEAAERSSKGGGGRWKATGITRSRQGWHRHASRPGTTIVGERCSLRRIQRWKSAAVQHISVYKRRVYKHACYTEIFLWNFGLIYGINFEIECASVNFCVNLILFCICFFFILNWNIFKLFYGVLFFNEILDVKYLPLYLLLIWKWYSVILKSIIIFFKF